MLTTFLQSMTRVTSADSVGPRTVFKATPERDQWKNTDTSVEERGL